MSRYCRHGCDPRNCSDCDSVTGEALPLVACSPSSTPETDAAEFPVMTWPSQDNPLVARSTLARKLEAERDGAVRIIKQIEERYIDGCDTYEDWKFMGDAAQEFLSENRKLSQPSPE